MLRNTLAINKNIMFIDCETTGISCKENTAIEWGMVLYDPILRGTICHHSFLLPCSRNPAFSANRIHSALTNTLHETVIDCQIELFEYLIKSADLIISHNVKFDKAFLVKDMGEVDIPFLCSMEEIEWSKYNKTKWPKLSELASLYEIHNSSEHRALSDAITLANIFHSELEKCGQINIKGRDCLIWP